MNFKTRIEPAFNYSVTDVFSGWEGTIDCFYELVKLIQSTGTTEQLTEMIKICTKYDIDLDDKEVKEHEQND